MVFIVILSLLSPRRQCKCVVEFELFLISPENRAICMADTVGDYALSCPVLSCPLLSSLVLSCPVLSCPLLYSPVLSIEPSVTATLAYASPPLRRRPAVLTDS